MHNNACPPHPPLPPFPLDEICVLSNSKKLSGSINVSFTVNWIIHEGAIPSLSGNSLLLKRSKFFYFCFTFIVLWQKQTAIVTDAFREEKCWIESKNGKTNRRCSGQIISCHDDCTEKIEFCHCKIPRNNNARVNGGTSHDKSYSVLLVSSAQTQPQCCCVLHIRSALHQSFQHPGCLRSRICSQSTCSLLWCVHCFWSMLLLA